jgi:transposase
MLNLDNTRRYFVYQGVTDFRKGINGLCGIIREELGQEPLEGGVYIFFNRHRNRVKILSWDQDGFMLYYKCLERGRFEKLADNNRKSIQISSTDLRMILEGIELKSIRKRQRFSLQKIA